jgi:DNA polymerase-3 subunit alpha
MSSAYTGFYYVPRIDRKLFKIQRRYIIVSGNLYGEIRIGLNLGENQAEETLIWWKEEFKR